MGRTSAAGGDGPNATKLIKTRIPPLSMATDGDAPKQPPEADMLPDERAVIAERLDELEDEESHLSVDDVADDLGIDLE